MTDDNHESTTDSSPGGQLYESGTDETTEDGNGVPPGPPRFLADESSTYRWNMDQMGSGATHHKNGADSNDHGNGGSCQ